MANDRSEHQFGLDYRRFFDAAEMIHRLLPRVLHEAAGGWVGRRLSPYRRRRARIEKAMSEGLGLAAAAAELAADNWLASHGAFGITVFDYGSLDRDWLARRVHVDDPPHLARIVDAGGLVLTFHSHHHNTLGSILGLAGCHITGIAASAAGSPLYSAIGDIIDRINSGSAKHFGGGHYLYTDQPRALVQGARRLLQQGRVIVNLCDFPSGALTAPAAMLLGREIRPPSGVVEIALNLEVPIHVAALFPDRGRLRLHSCELLPSASLDITLQHYFDFLSNLVHLYPHAWQGWDWFPSLPLMECQRV